jgi:hypothetical protein
MIAPTPVTTDENSASMLKPNLTGHNTPRLRNRTRAPEADVEALIAAHAKEDYRSPTQAISAYIRAVYQEVGTWRAVGALASRVTGRGYREPAGSAQGWADGTSRCPADVLFALQQIPALRHIRLSDYALAPSGADPAVFRELRDELAELGEHLDRLETLAPSVSAVVAVLLADKSLGPAIRLALERAHAGGVDPAAAQYLADAQTD